MRVLGSRHSFSDIADSTELVSLAGLPADVVVERAAGTVSFGAGMTYGDLAGVLWHEGLALHNLASLPHISVAGAVATATHGSGDASGNLATAVAGLEIVTSGGEIVTASRGDADFDGLVVGLGALGAVTRLTLDVEPAYDVRQRVFEGLTWDALYGHFDEITASGDSVSVFTRVARVVDQVWVKSRVTDAPEQVRGDLFGAARRDGRPPPDPGSGPRQLHAPARATGPLVGPHAAFSPGFHAQQRRGAPVRVPRAARACRGGDPGNAGPGRPYPPGAAGVSRSARSPPTGCG